MSFTVPLTGFLSETEEHAMAATAGGGYPFLSGTGHPPARFFRWFGAPPAPVAPGAGSPVDGVSFFRQSEDANGTLHDPMVCYLALRGRPIFVETGAAVAANQLLESDAAGRAVPHVSGTAVARALESAPGPGVGIWAVFA